jgi:hypothetical protein
LILQKESLKEEGKTNILWQKMMRKGGTPCRGCEQYHTCAIHEVACEQFEEYVSTGEIELMLPKIPTKEIFMGIYFEEEIEGEL